MSFATPLKQSSSGIETAIAVAAGLPNTTAKPVDSDGSKKVARARKPPAAAAAGGAAVALEQPSVGDVLKAANPEEGKKMKKVTSKKADASPTAVPRPDSANATTATQLQFLPCVVCKLATPFCCHTGKLHDFVVPPCPSCGLKSLFCPNTGLEHPAAHAAAQLVGNRQPTVGAVLPLQKQATPAKMEIALQPPVVEQAKKVTKKVRAAEAAVSSSSAPAVALGAASTDPAPDASSEKQPKKRRTEKKQEVQVSPIPAPAAAGEDVGPTLADRVALIVNSPTDGGKVKSSSTGTAADAKPQPAPKRVYKKREPKAEGIVQAPSEVTNPPTEAVNVPSEQQQKKKKAASEAKDVKLLQPVSFPAVAVDLAAQRPSAVPCDRCSVKVRLGSKNSDAMESPTTVNPPGTNNTAAVPPHQCVSCKTCGKYFHRSCYLAETGILPAKKNNLTVEQLEDMPCVCCRCDVLTLESLEKARALCGPDAAQYVQELLIDGCTVVPLFPSADDADDESAPDDSSLEEQREAKLRELRLQIMAYFHALQCSYELEMETRGSVPALSTGYSNFRERCAGRFEIIAPFIRQAVQQDLLAWQDSDRIPAAEGEGATEKAPPLCTFDSKSLVGQVLRAALGPDMKFMSAGCFLSMPNAAGQNTHTDGPLLSKQHNLFPYAINVFIPLVDVGPANGTEFFPGTQLAEAAQLATNGVHDGSNEAGAGGEDTPLTLPLPSTQDSGTTSGRRLVPLASPGHALLFDYRVLHRGLANRTGEARPCLYATFARDWYTDIYNFGAERYRRELPVAQHFLEAREARASRRDSQRVAAE